MIIVEKVEVVGLKHAIRGMRNPMNSWSKSDSGPTNILHNPDAVECGYELPGEYEVGPKDLELMNKLAKGGPVHAKYRRMIAVYLDITAPLYWWKEFDTYKVGTVANSCSTMHKIHEREFTLGDFSHEHLMDELDFERTFESYLITTIEGLNEARTLYLETKDKFYWWQMVQLLPSSYNQRRTIMLNYEVLAAMYNDRKDHKLDEWRAFYLCVESLPYSEVITCKKISDAERVMRLLDEGKTPNEIRKIFGLPVKDGYAPNIVIHDELCTKEEADGPT